MNADIFLFFYGFAKQSPFIDGVIVFFADYLAYILVAIIIAVIVFGKNTRAEKIRQGIQLIVAGILSRGIMVEIIRFFYQHPRPFFEFPQIHPLLVESSYSFPSGHAAFFFALSAVMYRQNKTFGTILFVASSIMGIARIMAGVHYPLDILGGAILGTIIGLLSVKLIKSPTTKRTE